MMQKKSWKNDIQIYRDFLSVLGLEGKVNDNNITISAGSIMTLEDFLLLKGTGSGSGAGMNYEDVERLILHIGEQMMVLEKYKKGIFFLTLADIIVIDKKFFLLDNLTHVLNRYKNEQLMLSYPMKVTKEDELFLAPELKGGLNTLPFYASITVGYYSLAKLCIYCLGLEQLDPLKGSKMYFFLLRCLQVDPAERYFLYI